MQKKRRSLSRETTLSRYARITAWRPSLSIRIDQKRGCPAERATCHCLQFLAQLEEPVKELTLIDGMIFVEGSDYYPPDVVRCVGSITAMRDCIQLGVTLKPQEYSWLLTMVAGNLLGACYLSFSPPKRGKAFIQSISFDKDLPPPDER
jgi:hypothetical protein